MNDIENTKIHPVEKPTDDCDVNDRYSDIINLPHHVSRIHKPMSMEARAGQFAPFAALVSDNDDESNIFSRKTKP